jgi:hypothetical protein
MSKHTNLGADIRQYTSRTWAFRKHFSRARNYCYNYFRVQRNIFIIIFTCTHRLFIIISTCTYQFFIIISIRGVTCILCVNNERACVVLKETLFKSFSRRDTRAAHQPSVAFSSRLVGIYRSKHCAVAPLVPRHPSLPAAPIFTVHGGRRGIRGFAAFYNLGLRILSTASIRTVARTITLLVERRLAPLWVTEYGCG